MDAECLSPRQGAAYSLERGQQEMGWRPAWAAGSKGLSLNPGPCTYYTLGRCPSPSVPQLPHA